MTGAQFVHVCPTFAKVGLACGLGALVLPGDTMNG